MDPFEELNKYHEYQMSGGDSDRSNNGGGCSGDGSGCVTLLIIGVILYIIFSIIGSR